MTWERKIQKKSAWNSAPVEKSIFPKQRGSQRDDGTNDASPTGICKGHGFNLLNLKTYPDSPSPVQAKLTVGAPGDKYEQEADTMAAQVMSMPEPATSVPIQREMAPEEQEEEVQTKALADSITPLVQREIASEEEEEAVQTKPALQRAEDSSFDASSSLESRLSSSKGGGSPLPDDVQGFMEPRFGNKFDNVRVHTGDEAVQMNRELGAQAFTHGSDIYFGAGKAPGNNELTAHELTHVVQQTSENQSMLNKAPTAGGGISVNILPYEVKVPFLETETNAVKLKYSITSKGSLEGGGANAAGNKATFSAGGPSYESGKGFATGTKKEYELRIKQWLDQNGRKLNSTLKPSFEVTTQGIKLGAEAALEDEIIKLGAKFTPFKKEWGKDTKLFALAFYAETSKVFEIQLDDNVKYKARFGVEGEIQPSWKLLLNSALETYEAASVTELAAVGVGVAGAVMAIAIYLDAISEGEEIAKQSSETAAALQKYCLGFENTARLQSGGTSEQEKVGTKNAEDRLTKAVAKVPQIVLVAKAHELDLYNEAYNIAKPEFRKMAIDKYKQEHRMEMLLSFGQGQGTGLLLFTRVLDAKLNNASNRGRSF